MYDCIAGLCTLNSSKANSDLCIFFWKIILQDIMNQFLSYLFKGHLAFTWKIDIKALVFLITYYKILHLQHA